MSEERRKYFRFNETIMMTYSLTNKDDAIPENQLAIDLIDEFSSMSQQLKLSVARMTQRSAELGNCMGILDSKINLLAQTVLYKDRANTFSRYKANISAGGISFQVSETIPIDSILNLQMVLSPELNTLNVKAKVVNCQKDSSIETPQNYIVSTNFVETSDITEDIIVRHIMRCQADELRAKKSLD